jgi:hypothetical protein
MSDSVYFPLYIDTGGGLDLYGASGVVGEALNGYPQATVNQDVKVFVDPANGRNSSVGVNGAVVKRPGDGCDGRQSPLRDRPVC